ncbi:MAG: ATP-binding protein, partial [Chromatiales bacterium]|nr:ATP-binding protein [Chromatiales bacterium]
LSWRSIPQDGGLMFATARDVTQRNKAEHEIHRLNADLERQVQERTRALEDLNNKEQEIRAVVDNLLDCVITIDAQGIVQNVNPMLTKIFGYAPDEIVGQNVSMLMPEPHRGQHDGYLARYLETGEVHVIGVGREVEGRHRSGRLIPLELSVNEYEMRGQRMFIGTLRDIHERKRLIADLTRARLEAEQANRAKSAFLATMSHEIRTPMNGVIGMVDVLAHSRLSEYQADLVHTIRESASTLLSLIDDILDFSKIEAGKLEIEHVPVSVADLVEGLCNSMVTVAARRGVDLFLFVSPAIPERVLSDDVRLRQMLYNLIGNAIKFSSGRTGKRGRVSVRAEVAQTDPLQLSFAIADNGIGMTPATVDQLFTPFTQAEVSTTRRYGGTGLGLTICKRLVDMMQGGIAVASEPGEGSTFTVTLPFDVPAEQPVRELPDLGGIDCILVENRELDVGGLRIYLEHAGAKVRQVSGEDAIGPLAAQMSGPVVAIRFVAQERTGQERTAQEAIDFPLPNLGYLLISRGRRRRARVQAPGVVSLDGDALRRQALLRAVAVAAGRASPEVFHDDAREALPGEDLTPPSITDARAKGRLILVAEDDEINQKVILRQLALLGYAAEVAGNGREALRLWEEGGYALLLTDLHMPEMDGYTLTENIRRKEQGGRRMPILALTANALRGEANRAAAAGMDEYLTKPVTLPNLKAALEKWMPPDNGASTMVEEQPVNHAKPVLDVSILKGLVGDDMGVVTEFLADFLKSARRHVKDLRAAEAAGDVPQLTSIAHKLKSSSRSVGALMFGDLCAGLESAGKSGDRPFIAQGMAALEQAFAEVEAEITRIVGVS